jgi:hypothetical protein
MPVVSPLNASARLALLYWRIAIWRRGPQDLPAEGILLPLTIAAYVPISARSGQPLAVGHILRATLERTLGLCLILAFIQMSAEEMQLMIISPVGH